MSTDLVIAEPHQVPKITDFETIRKYQDMADIARHFDLSYQEGVELVRFRIYLTIRAGQLYAALPDESVAGPGRGHTEKVVNQVDEVLTTKQSAAETLGKSRETISQWVKMANIEDPYQRADAYCDRCVSVMLEPTLKSYYHWLFGIIASHHTAWTHAIPKKSTSKFSSKPQKKISRDCESCPYGAINRHI